LKKGLKRGVVKGCITITSAGVKTSSSEVLAKMPRIERAKNDDCRCDPAFMDMLERANIALGESLQHGFFRLGITGEIGNGKKRNVVIDAGKLYRYVIPEQALS
jgi:hypothetical protein